MKFVDRTSFQIGDLVTVKGMKPDEPFCIVQLKKDEKKQDLAILKALFEDTYIIEKPIHHLTSLLIRGNL